ncbi:hypothetical protein [Streptomyces sp. NPDC047043]|uniref:hypothetical protein n=1 Tax=Streptomyces sp. NPDC047043 TaxID=3154497 RepID=UPI0033CAED13
MDEAADALPLAEVTAVIQRVHHVVHGSAYRHLYGKRLGEKRRRHGRRIGVSGWMRTGEGQIVWPPSTLRLRFL